MLQTALPSEGGKLPCCVQEALHSRGLQEANLWVQHVLCGLNSNYANMYDVLSLTRLLPSPVRWV